MEGYTRQKPNTSWWLTQIRHGIKYRKDFAMENQWELWRRYYRGRWSNQVLPSNIFFKMLRTIVPRVYFRNPSVSVQAAKPGIEQLVFAQILGRVDNKLIRSMRVKQHAKAIVQDSFLFGTGIGKLGFGAQYTPTPDALSTDAPTGRSGQQVEYHADVEPNMPWFMRTPTGNFIVPAGARTLQECPWVGEWHRRPLDDVKNDDRLSNARDLKATSKSGFAGHDSVYGGGKRNQKTAEGVDMIDLVEIRDKRTGRIIILAPYSTEKVLLDSADALQHSRGVPYYDVIFNPDDEVFWGVPDSQILEPQQREKNEIRTIQMFHRRLSIIKILFKKKAISQAEITKLLSEDPLAAIEINGELTDVTTMTMADIPDGLIKMDTIVDDDVRETVGMGRNQFGEYAIGSADRTAHEAEIVRMASEIRVDERRDAMADMLVSMTEDLHHVIFNQWSAEQVVEVIGPMGVPFWVRYTPAMLRSGMYEVSVDPDSSVPETKAIRQQKAERLYTILKENPLVDPVQLTQYLMRESHGVAFDTMLRIPQGIGTQANPMNPGQYGQVLQAVGNRLPGLPQQQGQQGQPTESVSDILGGR